MRFEIWDEDVSVSDLRFKEKIRFEICPPLTVTVQVRGYKITNLSYDSDHAYLGAILCINFVVFILLKLCVKCEWSTFMGSRNS